MDWSDAPDSAEHVNRCEPPGAGTLHLCSDGLWNYRPEAADLAGLALPKALTDPLGAASDMVEFAIEAGGAANTTLVLIPHLGPPSPPPRPLAPINSDPAGPPPRLRTP